MGWNSWPGKIGLQRSFLLRGGQGRCVLPGDPLGAPSTAALPPLIFYRPPAKKAGTSLSEGGSENRSPRLLWFHTCDLLMCVPGGALVTKRKHVCTESFITGVQKAVISFYLNINAISKGSFGSLVMEGLLSVGETGEKQHECPTVETVRRFCPRV